MISVFPALTASTVNPNALPGICKALEKFVVIYRMDGIIGAASAFQTAGKGLMMAPSAVAMAAKIAPTLAGIEYELVNPILTEKDLSPPDEEEYYDSMKRGESWEDFTKKKEYETGLRMDVEKFKDRLQFDRDKLKQKMDIFARDLNQFVDVKTPRFDTALSVEPTYVQVDRPFFGSSVLGVKVIPFQVKSDAKLINLIMHDRTSYGLERLLSRVKNSAMSLYHGAANKLRVPFLKGGTVTGDVHKDILYGKSMHWKNIFCILNYMDLGSDEFTTSPQGINKLHSMGWSSLIFTDDVNKRAIFCMKEYNGLCSTVQYPYLFSSLGKEHAVVYKDLEDVKASASPIFKMTIRSDKLALGAMKRR